MEESYLRLINELNKYIGELEEREKLIVIAGHPGSGKTTLAASICLAFAHQGLRCLYVSFQEYKEKFLEEIAGVGLKLTKFEEAGLFRFLKLPIVADDSSVNQLTNVIIKEITEYSPRIIIIDSISPLMRAVSSNIASRGYLQNFFYDLQKVIKGPVVLIAELPFGKEIIDLGDLEFVGDVIIILKHRVIRGLIARFMEIRKVRGHELTIAEIPFSIRSKAGISLLSPPILSEISEVEEYTETPCEILRREIPRIHKSISIYYEYPAKSKPWAPATYIALLGLHAYNSRKPILFITYMYPRNMILLAFNQIIERYTGCEECADLITGKIIVEPINPYAYSLTELNALENELIDKLDPGMVIFHDVGILMNSMKSVEDYIHMLQNQIFYFKRKGIMIARIASRITPRVSKLNKSISDLVMEANCINNCLDYNVYMWARFGNPKLLKSNELRECIKEVTYKVVNMMKSKHSSRLDQQR
ncbi:MAG: ATPase domain-containing protein [Nitrososphaerota archaeon]